MIKTWHENKLLSTDKQTWSASASRYRSDRSGVLQNCNAYQQHLSCLRPCTSGRPASSWWLSVCASKNAFMNRGLLATADGGVVHVSHSHSLSTAQPVWWSLCWPWPVQMQPWRHHLCRSRHRWKGLTAGSLSGLWRGVRRWQIVAYIIWLCPPDLGSLRLIPSSIRACNGDSARGHFHVCLQFFLSEYIQVRCRSFPCATGFSSNAEEPTRKFEHNMFITLYEQVVCSVR